MGKYGRIRVHRVKLMRIWIKRDLIYKCGYASGRTFYHVPYPHYVYSSGEFLELTVNMDYVDLSLHQ